MARKRKDLFGFEQLNKAFERAQKTYPNEADALLMATGRTVTKQVKRDTEKITGTLRKSWKLKKVKQYKSGTVRVVRICSYAPHAHLYEYGHYIKPRGRGRNNRADSRRYRYEKGSSGATGFVEGRYPLQKAMDQSRARFGNDAQKLINDITSDLKI